MSDELMDDEEFEALAEHMQRVRIKPPPGWIAVICPICGAEVAIDPATRDQLQYCPSCRQHFVPV